MKFIATYLDASDALTKYRIVATVRVEFLFARETVGFGRQHSASLATPVEDDDNAMLPQRRYTCTVRDSRIYTCSVVPMTLSQQSEWPFQPQRLVYCHVAKYSEYSSADASLRRA